jgi:hypothetical protein
LSLTFAPLSPGVAVIKVVITFYLKLVWLAFTVEANDDDNEDNAAAAAADYDNDDDDDDDDNDSDDDDD